MRFNWLKTPWRSASTIFRHYRSFCDNVCEFTEGADNRFKLTKGKSVAGKNVAYVGGYGGIGYCCCKQLLRDGVQHLVVLDVIENHRKRRCLRLFNPAAKCDFVKLDLCEGKEAIAEALKKVVKLMGQIDILVNGSGVLNERDPAKTVNVNLTGLVETTLAAIPLMSKMEGGKGGLIVNVACVYGLEPAGFAAVYTASKHAVIGFTRSLSHNLYYVHTKIKYVAVCPGPTATTMFSTKKIADRLTLPAAQTMGHRMTAVKTQTAEACGTAIAKTIKNAENGDVIIVNLGSTKKATMVKYC